MILEKPINIPIKDFNEHLNKVNNERILFSGRYGVGKTWFINKFFKQNTDAHIKIHLYPVNYSVAGNKDIFELIKVDILFEILKLKLIDFDSFNFNNSLLLQQYIINKATRFFPFLFEASKQIGEHILDSEDIENVNVISGLVKLINKVSASPSLEEYKKEVEKNQDLKDIEAFFSSKEEEIGNVYEYNLITKLLIELIEELRTEKKNIILVIDDLDRIDPEHVFRILNVFSAHFDIEGSGNKFGFDKVIFVCDINNLKSTFHHRYGAVTDFEGYINKFFSSEVYKYDNSENISNIVDSVLTNNHKISSKGDTYFIVSEILKFGIQKGKISLRNLLQDKSSFDIYNNSLTVTLEKTNFKMSNFLVLESIKTLSGILNGIDNLIDTLEKVKNSGDNPFASVKLRNLNDVLPLIDINNVCLRFRLKEESGSNFKYEYNNYKMVHNFNGALYESIKSENIKCTRQNSIGQEEPVETLNMMPFYIEACRKAKELGFIE